MSYNNEVYVVEKQDVKQDDLKLEPTKVRNNDNYSFQSSSSFFTWLHDGHDGVAKLWELKSIFMQIHCLFQLIMRSP